MVLLRERKLDLNRYFLGLIPAHRGKRVAALMEAKGGGRWS